MIDLIYFEKKDVQWSLGQSLYSDYEVDSIIFSIDKYLDTKSLPFLIYVDHIRSGLYKKLSILN